MSKSEDFGKAADAVAGVGEVAGSAADSGIVKPATAQKVAFGSSVLSAILRIVSSLSAKKK